MSKRKRHTYSVTLEFKTETPVMKMPCDFEKKILVRGRNHRKTEKYVRRVLKKYGILDATKIKSVVQIVRQV